MSRRSIERRLEGLLARAQSAVLLVDATVLVTVGTWEAFLHGDGESRERIREDVAGQ